jgi:hypothetical protein
VLDRVKRRARGTAQQQLAFEQSTIQGAAPEDVRSAHSAVFRLKLVLTTDIS